MKKLFFFIAFFLFTGTAMAAPYVHPRLTTWWNGRLQNSLSPKRTQSPGNARPSTKFRIVSRARPIFSACCAN